VERQEAVIPAVDTVERQEAVIPAVDTGERQELDMLLLHLSSRLQFPLMVLLKEEVINSAVFPLQILNNLRIFVIHCLNNFIGPHIYFLNYFHYRPYLYRF
jgi:hypothetical protein